MERITKLAGTGGLVFELNAGAFLSGQGFSGETFTDNGDGSFFASEPTGGFITTPINNFRNSNTFPIVVTTAATPEPTSPAVLNLVGTAGLARRRRR